MSCGAVEPPKVTELEIRRVRTPVQACLLPRPGTWPSPALCQPLEGILTLLLFFFFLTRFGRYRCEKGTTAVLTEKVTTLEIEVLEETVQTMDTS